MRRSGILAAAALAGCVGTLEGSPEDRPAAKTEAGAVLGESFSCDPGKERHGGARIWRLTASHYNNTVARLFGIAVPSIDSDNEEIFRGGQEAGFLNGAFALRVQDAQAGQFRKLARAIAER